MTQIKAMKTLQLYHTDGLMATLPLVRFLRLGFRFSWESVRAVRICEIFVGDLAVLGSSRRMNFGPISGCPQDPHCRR